MPDSMIMGIESTGNVSDLDADSQCMSRLQQGEDLALNELMDRWQKPLVSYFYRYFGNMEEALDLAQETFVRIYESRHRYRSSGNFAAWLFTIAGNLRRNLSRWHARHPTVPLESNDRQRPHCPEQESESETPYDSAEQSELAAAVRDQIQALPEDLRTVLLLFEYEDLSYQEIATIVGVSPKAVEMRLYRARNVLREKLSGWASP